MCIFCKIIDGSIPSYKVYEDSLFVAFLDISQATIGHTLIVPKKHYESIIDLGEEEQSKLTIVINKLAKQLFSAFDIKNLNILNNNGPLAGQTVNHFHVHLIPRYSANDVIIEFKPNSISKEEFENIQTKFINT